MSKATPNSRVGAYVGMAVGLLLASGIAVRDHFAGRGHANPASGHAAFTYGVARISDGGQLELWRRGNGITVLVHATPQPDCDVDPSWPGEFFDPLLYEHVRMRGSIDGGGAIVVQGRIAPLGHLSRPQFRRWGFGRLADLRLRGWLRHGVITGYYTLHDTFLSGKRIVAYCHRSGTFRST